MTRNSDATAAYKRRTAQDIVFTDFTVYANRDAPGNDYRRIRRSDFVQCFVECVKDDRCRAFAFVRKRADCWLKDAITAPRRNNGVELGIK